jgi:integrase
MARDGKRKTIRLGKASMSQAETVKVRIESLVTSQFSGRIDDEVARWLTSLSDRKYTKLVRAGLVPPRAAKAPEPRSPAAVVDTLAAFLDDYIASRCDVKPNTQLVFGRTRKHLVAHFGKDKPLGDITEGDADAWRLYLIRYGLAENTVRRTCGVARQFFRAAVRRRLIASNPFSTLKVTVKGNKAREFFVSRADSEKILAACPNTEWKLIFSLARFGGLRTPSEILLLRWQDINWDQHRMLVRSPKTEHHAGGESRFVPIFPELDALLTLALAEAEPGPGYVIAKHRVMGANLRTHMMRILAKAGVKPWPKLFQNLRSTRQTELCQSWPEHVVCAWLGNSRLIAREHYLQVTDEHFEKAAQKTAQFPAQRPAAADCDELRARRESGDFASEMQVLAVGDTSPQGIPVGGAGLEHTAFLPPKTAISQISPKSGTKSGTVESDSDPDLAFLVRHWHDLRPNVRAEILRLAGLPAERE